MKITVESRNNRHTLMAENDHSRLVLAECANRHVADVLQTVLQGAVALDTETKSHVKYFPNTYVTESIASVNRSVKGALLLGLLSD